ncbi:MAG: twin-arginine translocase subunit TatC [Candidatus Tectomicrobia bacterium]|uniref:Sec-independent protein translocase protein TatC n=1 Tax=Tectimicrobiota bacterium TaxID=2528274 RepID=A0A932CMM4_UNCTE|nr:twin-arginine translocase subunit TatC [Candidatus Tectomicrobia bacterium]
MAEAVKEAIELAEEERSEKPFVDLSSLLQVGEQLRHHLVRLVVPIGLTGLLVYPFADFIIALLSRPLKDAHASLAFYGMAEPLMARIKLTLFVSLFINMPIVLYRIQRMAASFPNFPAKRRQHALMIGLAAMILFYLGAALCLFGVLPFGMKFLIGYGGEHIRPLFSIDRYLTLCAILVLGFGLMFELPLVLFLLGLAGLVDTAQLAKNRRYAMVAILIVSAIVTPTPDAYTMLLLAIPIIVLFEVGIWLVWAVERRKGRKASYGMD